MSKKMDKIAFNLIQNLTKNEVKFLLKTLKDSELKITVDEKFKTLVVSYEEKN